MTKLYSALVLAVAACYGHAAGNLPDFKLLGGMGPYIARDGLGAPSFTPDSCNIDQVVSICRHGERYPVDWEIRDFTNTVEKLKQAGGLEGPLKFLENYEMKISKDDAEKETNTGPYNGHYDAEQLGKYYRYKYGHLLDQDKKLNIFTADQARVVDTAKHFSKGFFSDSKNLNASINVIELPEEGDPMNSLTPQNDCDHTFEEMEGDYTKQATEYRNSAIPQIVEKVKKFTKADLNVTDVYNLMALCPYEITSVGDSDFCRIFSEEDWKIYDYFNSLNTYYSSGAGQTGGLFASASVFTNSTLKVLQDGPENMGGLYFNFAHDGQLAAILGSLNLFVPKNGMPYHSRDDNCPFKISQIVPMLGNLILERITCDGEVYVRLNLNDAYVPIPDCQSGPGKSCPLNEYEKYIDVHYRSFSEECGTKDGKSKYLTFYWDHKNI